MYFPGYGNPSSYGALGSQYSSAAAPLRYLPASSSLAAPGANPAAQQQQRYMMYQSQPAPSISSSSAAAPFGHSQSGPGRASPSLYLSGSNSAPYQQAPPPAQMAAPSQAFSLQSSSSSSAAAMNYQRAGPYFGGNMMLQQAQRGGYPNLPQYQTQMHQQQPQLLKQQPQQQPQQPQQPHQPLSPRGVLNVSSSNPSSNGTNMSSSTSTMYYHPGTRSTAALTLQPTATTSSTKNLNLHPALFGNGVSSAISNNNNTNNNSNHISSLNSQQYTASAISPRYSATAPSLIPTQQQQQQPQYQSQYQSQQQQQRIIARPPMPGYAQPQPQQPQQPQQLSSMYGSNRIVQPSQMLQPSPFRSQPHAVYQPPPQPLRQQQQAPSFNFEMPDGEILNDNPLGVYHSELVQEMKALGLIVPPNNLDFSQLEALRIFKLHFDTIRRLHSWAVPNESALKAIAKYSPNGVVEMGSGTGYWAHMLSKRGVDIVAIDDNPVDGTVVNGSQALVLSFQIEPLNISFEYNDNPPPWHHVEKGSVESISKYSNRTLLLCWPPPEQNTFPKIGYVANYLGARSVEAFKGEYVVYVGEWFGKTLGEDPHGVTGGAEMQRALTAGYDCVEAVNIPNWPQIQDRLTVWRRKKNGTQQQQQQQQQMMMPLQRPTHTLNDRREPRIPRSSKQAEEDNPEDIRRKIIGVSKKVLLHQYCVEYLAQLPRLTAVQQKIWNEWKQEMSRQK